MLSSLNCLVSFQNHSCTKAIFKKNAYTCVIMVDIYSFLSFLLFVCWWPVWGCRKRGGPERTAGGRCGSAASDARRERRPWRRRTDTHRRHRDAHKMLRLRAVTNLRVWRKNEKKKKRNSERQTPEAPPRPRWSVRAGSAFAAENTIPPELPPMRFSCAWIPPFALQGPGLKPGGADDRVWWILLSECTLSASPSAHPLAPPSGWR